MQRPALQGEGLAASYGCEMANQDWAVWPTERRMRIMTIMSPDRSRGVA